MINWKILTILGVLLNTNFLAANSVSIYSNEFIDYHITAAVEEIEDEDIFYLIQENINHLKISSISDAAAKELINLIEEGYKIDPFNMSLLIDILKISNASHNATKVIVKAIEHNSTITTDHMLTLIDSLTISNASNNATTVIITAIEHGVKFGPKERLKLAQVSTVANARSNVEKIRKALHQREINSKG